MNRQRRYLQDILERIARIEEYTVDGQEVFYADRKGQDAVIRSFEVIGEAVKRLDATLTSQQPAIPWQQVAGFRDVLIHHYNEVDLDFVWQTIEQDIGPLKVAVQALLDDLND